MTLSLKITCRFLTLVFLATISVTYGANAAEDLDAIIMRRVAQDHEHEMKKGDTPPPQIQGSSSAHESSHSEEHHQEASSTSPKSQSSPDQSSLPYPPLKHRRTVSSAPKNNPKPKPKSAPVLLRK